MIKILSALLCVVILACPASADEGTKLSQAAADPLGAGILPVVGMHDMEGHRWGVSASPFLWKTEKIGRDGSCCAVGGGAVAVNDDLPSLDGVGGSLAVSYEFSPHWGMQAFGGVARGGKKDLPANQVSGLANTVAYAGTPGGAGFAGGTFNNLDATVVGAMVTWDPFDHPNGFRLPISAGFFQGYQSFDFDHAFANPNNGAAQVESVRFRRQFAGVVAAASFDFLLFKNVRLMPGMLVGQGFSGQEAQYAYRVQQNSGPTSQFNGTLTGWPGFGTIYVAANYRPWGIGYTVTLIPTVASTHALVWSHHFGPGREAK